MPTRGSSSQPWPQDVAVARREVPMRPAVPVCESWVLPLAEVAGWFAAAAPGDTLRYACGPFLVQGQTSAFVRDKGLDGLAHPTQTRRDDCVGFDFKVRKLADAVAPAKPPAEPDAALEAIFAIVERAAERERPCPSDTELARAAGLATRAQAAWRMTQLREAGRIASEKVTGRAGAERIVTIVATGKRTARGR